MHIVIDGYNLIRQSPRLKEIERQDLQAGREALVEALAAFKRMKPYAVTVVFDGHDAMPGMPRRDRLKGIRLHYSRPGELADDVIKRMVGREKEKLLVVTSDREIVSYAAARGAATISSIEFSERLEMASLCDGTGNDESGPSSGWAPTTKKKGPSRRLPKRKRKANRILSKL